jgi:hypothetical protein
LERCAAAQATLRSNVEIRLSFVTHFLISLQVPQRTTLTVFATEAGLSIMMYKKTK